MRQPVQVAVYCVRQHDDGWEYLLLHRVPKGGSFWQGVTGGMEDDENPNAAAVRELFEETGYVSKSIENINFSYTFKVDEKWRHLYGDEVDMITELVFVAIVDDNKEPDLGSGEHDDWRWCLFNEAQKLLFWPGNKKSLEHCREHLEKTR